MSISDIDIYKCTVNYMVRDFCMTTRKWHQLATLAWYDCPIHAKMKALIVLLRLIINLPDGNHNRKKDMNAKSVVTMVPFAL